MAYPILRRIFFAPFFKRFDHRVTGIENLPTTGGYILAANHVSFLDGMVMFTFHARKMDRKIFFLTKEDVTNGIGRWLSNYFAMIPVAKNQEDKSKALDPAVAMLHKGELVGIFPEAQRNTTAVLHKGKTGAVRLALMAHVPIVPMGIFGPPGWTMKETAKNYLTRGREVRMTFGLPMDFSASYNQDITKSLLDDLTRQLMTRIGSLCHKTYPH